MGTVLWDWWQLYYQNDNLGPHYLITPKTDAVLENDHKVKVILTTRCVINLSIMRT